MLPYFPGMKIHLTRAARWRRVRNLAAISFDKLPAYDALMDSL